MYHRQYPMYTLGPVKVRRGLQWYIAWYIKVLGGPALVHWCTAMVQLRYFQGEVTFPIVSGAAKAEAAVANGPDSCKPFSGASRLM